LFFVHFFKDRESNLEKVNVVTCVVVCVIYLSFVFGVVSILAMSISESEGAILQAVETIASTLSLISCSIVLYKLYSSDVIWNITNKQLLVLSVIDFILAVFWGIGRAGRYNDGFCVFQVLVVP
jgi:hypothetical protein